MMNKNIMTIVILIGTIIFVSGIVLAIFQPSICNTGNPEVEKPINIGLCLFCWLAPPCMIIPLAINDRKRK